MLTFMSFCEHCYTHVLFLIVLGSKSKADLDLQPVKGAVLMDIDDEPEVSDVTK